MSSLYINTDDETIQEFEALVQFENLALTNKKRTKKSIFADMLRLYRKTTNYKEFEKFRNSSFCKKDKKAVSA